MSKNTIKIKKYTDIICEYTAGEAIYPGSLLKLNSAGNVIKHTTAGSNVGSKLFALEDELQGKGIDDAYASGDKVQVWVATPGEIVLAILANGEDVEPGDFLESNGAGFLEAHVADYGDSHTGTVQEAIVGVCLQNMDASADSSGQDVGGGYGVNKRIQVRIV